jgi:hypothetical protein
MSLDDSTQDTQNRNELAKDNNTEAIDEDEGPHPAPSPILPGMGTCLQDVQSPSPSANSSFSAFARTLQVGPHQSGSISRASTCTPMNGPTQASQQSGGSVQDHMINFMDPAPRERQHAQIERCHAENGITQLYAFQLQEANKTIKNLHTKNN